MYLERQIHVSGTPHSCTWRAKFRQRVSASAQRQGLLRTPLFARLSQNWYLGERQQKLNWSLCALTLDSPEMEGEERRNKKAIFGDGGYGWNVPIWECLAGKSE